MQRTRHSRGWPGNMQIHGVVDFGTLQHQCSPQLPTQRTKLISGGQESQWERSSTLTLHQHKTINHAFHLWSGASFSLMAVRSDLRMLFITPETPWQWLVKIYEQCNNSRLHWSDEGHKNIAYHLHQLCENLSRRLNALQCFHWIWCQFYVSVFCFLSFSESQIPALRGTCEVVASNKIWTRGWQVGCSSPAATPVRIVCHGDHFKAIID